MKSELEEELFAIEPSWFERSSPSKSNMYFGFDTGDGWFKLLKDLLLVLKKLGAENFEIVQVKTKFGGLRFYYVGGGREVETVIDWAEQVSYFICEFCGENAKWRSLRGWQWTLCDKCWEKKKLEETP